MRLLILAVLVLVVLAIYFIVRAIQSRAKQKVEVKALPLSNGETNILICGEHGEVVYSNIAPLENYEKNGKSAFDRQADIDIALEDAQVWARKTKV